MVEEQEPKRKSRRERFKTVATRRTRQLLKDIQRLGNCANRSAYEYNEADVAKMFKAIEDALSATHARFDRPQRKEVDFSLE